jgi:hypothetical protein
VKRLVTVTLALALLIGCSGGDSTAPTPGFEGNFVLLEIINVAADGATIRVTPPQATGELRFTADGRFSGFFRFPDLGIDRSDGGTFVVNGSTLTLSHDDGSREGWEISADGRRITTIEVEVGETTTFVFVRS